VPPGTALLPQLSPKRTGVPVELVLIQLSPERTGSQSSGYYFSFLQKGLGPSGTDTNVVFICVTPVTPMSENVTNKTDRTATDNTDGIDNTRRP
jgi:hypothetical protein